MNSKFEIYSFLGLPACGKGTQAEILAQKLNIEKIVGVGHLVREIMSEEPDSELAIDIKRNYDAGIPQPDSIAIRLIEKYLNNQHSDVILDGFPLSCEQVTFMAEYYQSHSDTLKKPIVIYIKISPETAIKRAIERKTCPNCNKTYSDSSVSSCETCHIPLIVREDDNKETVINRINEYYPRLEEVTKYCQEIGYTLITIDGEQSIEEVSTQIDNEINKIEA